MKKIITILTLTTILFVSCGKDKKEVTNNEPAIKVVVNGLATNNSEFITASGKTEAESSANL
ncbi:MAG: efflux RND transporter periplasmic adaptor subunit, partial [Flavobacterium sp.]